VSTDDVGELPGSVLDRRWALTSQVSLRPERFGALLYHFGTRRLSFVKDRRLASALGSMAEAPSARDACTAAGIDATELPAYERALSQLVQTDMLQERTA
jgi:putative mycofactocin binding protein MftB